MVISILQVRKLQKKWLNNLLKVTYLVSVESGCKPSTNGHQGTYTVSEQNLPLKGLSITDTRNTWLLRGHSLTTGQQEPGSGMFLTDMG